MNCAECKELLVAGIEGLLAESQKQALVAHLKACSACKAEAKELKRLQNRLVRNGKTLAQSDLEDMVLGRIVKEQNVRLKATTRASKSLGIWRVIMKSPIPKLAAATVVVIALLYGLSLIGNGDGVAWAELIEHVEEIQTVAYRMKIAMKGLVEMYGGQAIDIELQAKLAYDHGFYMAGCTSVKDEEIVTNTYILFDEEAIVTVLPKQKKYMRMTLTDDLLAKMQEENGDPRTMLKEMMKYEYTIIGRDIIDGVEVEGIEVTDPAMALKGGGMFDELEAQLWCDVDTDLPVLMTMKGSAKNGEVSMDIVLDDFKWRVEIDPAEIRPNIPEDYELLAETGLGKLSEEEIVESLALFAEFADGTYPSSMTGMTVIKEFVDALQIKFASDPPAGEPNEAVMGGMIKLQTIGMTYAALVQDGNDPAYYGDKVTVEFPHAVLMRWKKPDDSYTVIFGDLSIRNVTPQELAELEAVPLNLESYAIKPEPTDGIAGTPLVGVELSWISGAYATGHQVYFGTTIDELPLLAEVTEPNYTELPALEKATTYYWRVDELQPDGSIVTGTIWSFSTGGLVGWWRLDDGSGSTAVDASGNGLDGTLVGDPVWVDGRMDGALALDGDGDYVNLGNNPMFNITNQITIAAWIKVDVFDKEWQAIIAKGDSSWRIQRNRGKGSLEFACSGLAIPNTRWGNISGTVDVNDGQWHHVVGTYDGSQICLYVDGTLDASSKVIGGSIKINEQPVLIGENSEAPKRFWNGLIDEVRVYNRGLSADEVAAMYAGLIEQN